MAVKIFNPDPVCEAPRIDVYDEDIEEFKVREHFNCRIVDFEQLLKLYMPDKYEGGPPTGHVTLYRKTKTGEMLWVTSRYISRPKNQ